MVIGDVSPDEAKAVIGKWFGDWKAEGPKPDTTLPPVPINKPSAVNVPDPERVQDSVTLAEQLNINRFDPDYYPLQLGNHVLGGGFYATRLYHDLRQVAGYVYTVDASLQASKTRGGYSVTYGCDPENVSKARALIERDLEQMQTQDVTADELHQAKALLLRQLPLSESSEDAVAEGMLRRAQYWIAARRTAAGCEAVLCHHRGSGEGRLRQTTASKGLCASGARAGTAVERFSCRCRPGR